MHTYISDQTSCNIYLYTFLDRERERETLYKLESLIISQSIVT